MSNFEIKEVKNRQDWRQFIKLPWLIYKDDPYWVPPLIFDVKRQLKKNNPFFKQAEANYWIAVNNQGVCLGRVASIVNQQHNHYYNDRVGFFGYFECVNDNKVSNALLASAHQWLSNKGMISVRGPVNLSLTNESGLLIEGPESSPFIQMNYNPAYYLRLLEDSGYQKEHDLLAFHIGIYTSNEGRVMQRLQRLSEIVTKKKHVVFRIFNTKDFKGELQKIRKLFNDYMSDNWGFLPMEESELDFMAQSLKPILIKELAIFAEVNGETVGFSLTLPDINEVLKRMNGKLFPFGVFKFLLYRKTISTVRVLLMGINKHFRKQGLEAVFYYQTMIKLSKRRFTGAELSWISEDNHIMIRELESLGAKLYKRYRILQRQLDDSHTRNLKTVC